MFSDMILEQQQQSRALIYQLLFLRLVCAPRSVFYSNATLSAPVNRVLCLAADARYRTAADAAPASQHWPGVEESSPSEEEWRKQSAPTYRAYAFNDAEVAELGRAGGLGMLGTRFHRHTTVNW